jgi:hypothetical protein
MHGKSSVSPPLLAIHVSRCLRWSCRFHSLARWSTTVQFLNCLAGRVEGVELFAETAIVAVRPLGGRGHADENNRVADDMRMALLE